MKAKHAREVKRFTDIPNIGPAIAKDFVLLGLKTPHDLKGRNAHALYTALCRKTHSRQDPCVLDTFLAAVDFMNGAKARPWWAYTNGRKKEFPDI